MAHIGGWMWDLKTDEASWSEEMYRIYGVEPGGYEITYRNFLERIHPEDREHTDRTIRRCISEGEGWTAGRRIVRPDGEVRHLRGRTEAELDEEGRTVRLRGFEQDVTELIEAERGLLDAEQRYRHLVERLPAISYVAEVGITGEWVYVSPQIEEMYGYTAEEWRADPAIWHRCVHPDDLQRAVEAEERGIVSGGPIAIEYRVLAKDGHQLWVRDEFVVHTEDGTAYVDGIVTEITERKAFESELQYLADHDPLTGLFNRRRFLEELGLQMKLRRREGVAGSLAMLDLDNFKYVNDSLGHSAGDELIRSVATLARGRLREVDTLARLGGDEFAVLLRNADADAAEKVVEDLLESIRERPHPIADEPVRITASAGLTDLELAVDDAEELLAAADVAMYEAKQRGRDRLARFSPELKRQVQRGRSWADRIRTALEDDGFLLYQQPIVELAGGRVAQHEILLRMRGSEGGVVEPAAFLPVAERFDLIQAIDRWVTMRAIELMKSCLGRGRRLRLEVNLSGRSIGDDELVDAIEAALGGTEIDPADLIFEVTETAAIANMERARAFSERLSALGCRFALDDFGSGFASFFYLKHLPVDFVKIDGDFVRGLAGSDVDQEVIRAMIGVTRALGQQTIAEFVTDRATLEILTELGVDYAQGYHLGAPAPVEALEQAPSPA
jgi:diguanylate cyclase (GGDEF)-like protein/PAS domain S-box-containing protein